MSHARVELNWDLVDSGQIEMLNMIYHHLEDNHAKRLAEHGPSVLRSLEQSSQDVNRDMQSVHRVIVCVLE